MKLTALAFLASSLFAQMTGNLSGTISGTFSGTFICTANCPTSGGSTGGSGAVTQIQQIVVSGTTTNAVTFAAIPGTFSNLQLIGSGRVSDNAASEYVMVQFNSDTAAHYNSQYSSGRARWPPQSQPPGVPQASVTIASFPGATAPANQPGSMLAWLAELQRDDVLQAGAFSVRLDRGIFDLRRLVRARGLDEHGSDNVNHADRSGRRNVHPRYHVHAVRVSVVPPGTRGRQSYYRAELCPQSRQHIDSTTRGNPRSATRDKPHGQRTARSIRPSATVPASTQAVPAQIFSSGSSPAQLPIWPARTSTVCRVSARRAR